MSVLSDSEIMHRIQVGKIVINPLDFDDIQPASVELHLDGWAKRLSEGTIIDPLKPPTEDQYERIDLPTVLSPSQLLIVSTVEWVEIPTQLVAEVWGKSSLARLGLLVHVTSGYVDPGFKGNITLECVNLNHVGIILRPGMNIGQINFSDVKGHVRRPYGTKGLGSRYLNQEGPTESRGIGDKSDLEID